MAQQAVAEVVGLRALMKDVNRLTKDERSPLFDAMKKAGYAAVSPVVANTRARLPVSSRPDSPSHRHGQLAATLRASAYRSGAAVRMGTTNVRWAGWVEFGGARHKPHDSSRPFLSAGRYLFPAARQVAPAAVRQYTDAVNKLFGRTAIWTNTTTDGQAVHD